VAPWHFDIDTPDQLLAWQLRDSDAVRAVLDVLRGRGVMSSDGSRSLRSTAPASSQSTDGAVPGSQRWRRR
jgi:hypothetical protein